MATSDITAQSLDDALHLEVDGMMKRLEKRFGTRLFVFFMARDIEGNAGCVGMKGTASPVTASETIIIGAADALKEIHNRSGE
jgi:hypothetical protein